METYVNAVASKAAVPIDLIAAIIAFIAQLVSGCVKPPTPAQVTSGGGTLGRVTIYRALLANGIRPLSTQGQAVYAAMVEEGPKLTPDDVQAFFALAATK